MNTPYESRLLKLLTDLVQAIENDGAAIHSERCGCELCDAIKAATAEVDR